MNILGLIPALLGAYLGYLFSRKYSFNRKHDFENKIYIDGNHCPAQILRNCVHPDLGLHILNCALNKIAHEGIKQGELFE